MTLKLSNLKIRDLLSALNQLDGFSEIVEQNGGKVSVRKPYVFPGKTIFNITKDIRILRKLVEAANKDRDDLLTRISEGTNEIDGEKDPEKAREFAKGVAAIEEDEIEVTGLLLLKMTDLLNDDLAEDDAKKDKKRVVNPIPQTALASLAPVLDVFQPEVETKTE